MTTRVLLLITAVCLTAAACSSSTSHPAASSTGTSSTSGSAAETSTPPTNSGAVDNGLTGLGAPIDYWDAHRNLDGNSPANAPAYGPDSTLPELNGRTGDRYTLINFSNAYVAAYQVNFYTGTDISNALTDVLHAEFPADAAWLWKHEVAGGCYQAEVKSAKLKTGLATAGLGDGSGEAFVEFQTVGDPSGTTFDTSNVTYASLSLMSYTAAGNAPGC